SWECRRAKCRWRADSCITRWALSELLNSIINLSIVCWSTAPASLPRRRTLTESAAVGGSRGHRHGSGESLYARPPSDDSGSGDQGAHAVPLYPRDESQSGEHYAAGGRGVV